MLDGCSIKSSWLRLQLLFLNFTSETAHKTFHKRAFNSADTAAVAAASAAAAAAARVKPATRIDSSPSKHDCIF